MEQVRADLDLTPHRMSQSLSRAPVYLVLTTLRDELTTKEDGRVEVKKVVNKFI